MKVSREEECWVCYGGPRQSKFKYRVYHAMNKEISDWLFATFKGFGQDYYWGNGKIWFKTAKQETLFLLRWA